MNPGYKGRTELPTGLNDLSYSMDFKVPDYTDIMTVMLQSTGIMNGRKMSEKLVGLVSDLAYSLEKRRHYDFGLRSLKSLAATCGALIKNTKDFNEEETLLKGIHRIYGIRIVQ